MRSRLVAVGVALLLAVVIRPLPAQAKEPSPAPVVGSAEFGVSPPLASIAPGPRPPEAGPSEPVKTVPKFKLPKGATPILDPVVQGTLAPLSVPAPTLTFEGLSNADNVSVFGFRSIPPDTNGDVGPNHYVQIVNSLFRVFDKNGAALAPPTKLSSVFAAAGLTGLCATHDDGDPIVLYDHLADRWLMSQFAFGKTAPFFQCIAISRTGDPTGGYFAYAVQMPTTKFNDYPHFGVWPDGYYMTDNQFRGSTPAGAGVFAFDRAKMLAGDPNAGFIYFDLASNEGGMLPSDLDGSPPPPGTPNYFVQFTGSGGSSALRVFEFRANFANPAASTFVERGDSPLSVAAFNPSMCNFSESCIPQPGTSTKVDALSDRLMHRVQYRHFTGACPIDTGLGSGCGTLVLNHTVDENGADHAGIRWYILKIADTSDALSVNQQATYAPDAHHRWMGSAAIDVQGNLAVGFSLSSSSVFPSIRYAGRLVTDPDGTLNQGEATLQAGGGSQTGSDRWGDYSMLAVDPQDECTFWYTTEYYSTSSSAGWRTRIGTFTLASCPTPPRGAISGTVTDASTHDPLAGALVRTSDGFARTTNGAGHYSLSVPPGTYSVTATAPGHDPASAAGVTVSDGSTTTQDLALTPTPPPPPPVSCLGTGSFSLSGRAGKLAGVTMALDGPSGCSDTTTSSRKGYAFATLRNGTYTVTPSKSGCSFTPPTATVKISGANKTANFSASCP
jgi:Carboxypeptidase regulatory-like domain